MTKRWISLVLVCCLLISLPVSVRAADLGVGTVKGGWLRLRSAPSTLGDVVGRYYTGTKVTVHYATGTWYYVTAPDGKTGYMSRNFLTLGSGGGGVTPIVPPGGGYTLSGETGYVTSANGRGVRLRSTPTTATSANIIGLYNVGTSLTVLQRGSAGWHYVQIGSQVGYMMAQFIVIGSHPVPPIDPVPVPPSGEGYQAYVTSLNGKGVRLRTGPGTNYGILGIYPVGTQVTVLKNLGAWCYIQIGSVTGYMMTTFLTAKTPVVPTALPTPPTPPTVGPGGTVTDAQITIQDPIVGDRLYVYVTPDGADVLVQWYNDLGQLLGTGNGYPVKKSDSGRRICARVTGRNKWSGSVITAYTDPVGGSGSPTPTPVPSVPLTGQVFLPVQVNVNDVLVPSPYGCNATALIFTWYVGGAKYAQQGTLKVTADMAGESIQVVATASGYSGSLTAITTVKPAATPKPTEGLVELITPAPKAPGGIAEPIAPVVEPVTPIAEPITPVVEPETPIAEPITPVVEPETPIVEPITPVVEPVTPVVEPVTPVAEPVTPVAEPVTPVVEPVTPVAEPVTPVVEPVTPVAEPVTPVVEPVTPVAEPVTPVVEPVTPVVETVAPVVEPVTSTAPETVETPSEPLVEAIVP